jgi:hypothetical protein
VSYLLVYPGAEALTHCHVLEDGDIHGTCIHTPTHTQLGRCTKKKFSLSQNLSRTRVTWCTSVDAWRGEAGGGGGGAHTWTTPVSHALSRVRRDALINHFNSLPASNVELNLVPTVPKPAIVDVPSTLGCRIYSLDWTANLGCSPYKYIYLYYIPLDQKQISEDLIQLSTKFVILVTDTYFR